MVDHPTAPLPPTPAPPAADVHHPLVPPATSGGRDAPATRRRSRTAAAPAGRAAREALPHGLHRGPSGIWQTDTLRNGLRIRRSTGTKDIGEAVLVARRWTQHGIDALPGPHQLRHTLDDLIAMIGDELEQGRIRPGTHRAFMERIRALRAWHQEHRGDGPALHRIDTALIQEYLRWRRATPVTRNGHPTGDHRLPSARTVMKDLDLFRALFRRAVARGWMEAEPTAKIPRDRNAYQPRIRALGGDQVRRFLDALAAQVQAEPGTRSSGLRMLPAFCELALACGLRRDEVRMLTRADIDLRKRTLLVQPKTLHLQVVLTLGEEGWDRLQRSLRAGRRPERPRIPEFVPTEALHAAIWHGDLGVATVPVSWSWQLKGCARPRELPIPDPGMPLLERLLATSHRAWYPESPAVLARQDLDLPEPPFLLPGAEGGPLRSNMNREVNKAARTAGLNALRIHDLRHTYATMLRSKGAELTTIQRLLGHEDMDTTLMYAHYTDAEGRKAVEGLSW
jgi:integrase